MNVISTRDTKEKVTSLQAVLQGIARNGGLFVPESFPKLDMKKAEEKAKEGYDALCAYVLGLYFELPEKQLAEIAKSAYSSFDVPEVVPLRGLADNEYIMELTHGPTLAFKDMALQVLPRLTQAALEHSQLKKDILILTATSGDTGKAALEGFKDVPRTAIYVFYPEHGVAPMQRLQMVTQTGDNTGVCGVKGNFDDAQTGVKQMFADTTFKRKVSARGYSLSSANSINFGRLVPQIAYYVYSYCKLVEWESIKDGDTINFCVPTGNFGNILAAFYAKQMGLPVSKLICASNANNVLTEFFHTGIYDADRDLQKTMSPSMDILVSSNLERLLFELSGRDDDAVRLWMMKLNARGRFTIPPEIREKFSDLIWSSWCSDTVAGQVLQEVFVGYGYLMDPHTSVAQAAFRAYREETGDMRPTVTVSTANPYKFTRDVLYAVTGIAVDDAFEAARQLSWFTHTAIPPQIAELEQQPVLHDGSTEKNDMEEPVIEFLKEMKAKHETAASKKHAPAAAKE